MNTTIINLDTFASILLVACCDAVKAHPTKTPIFIHAGGKGWTPCSNLEGFVPVDPTGDLFHNFVTERGTTKVTVKAAGAFVRRNAEGLYEAFVARCTGEPETDPQETVEVAEIAPEETPAAIDAPTNDAADVEAVVAASEGNEKAAPEAAQEAVEEPITEAKEDVVTDELEAKECASEAKTDNERGAEGEKDAEAPAPFATEQPRRRGPQPMARVKFEPGAVNLRSFKGQTYEVAVLADGKRCTIDGKEFSSLSTAAKEVLGLHVSGLKFWGFVR